MQLILLKRANRMSFARPFDGIETTSQAVEFLRARFAEQLEAAITKAVAPNEAVEGDARVRDAFWALLSPEDQRAFFLKIIGKCRFWPRLRTLVGTPPYSFLRSEDEGVLRASGICKNRVNMTQNETTATAYTEFRHGHYEDSAGRLYRMIAKERPNGNDLPWNGIVSGVRIVTDIRVQKRAMATKMTIAKGERGSASQASLVFPRVGDIVRLKLVPALRSTGVDGDLRATVDFGRQRAPASPVARLVLRIH